MTLTVTPAPARPPVLRRRWVRVLLWTAGTVTALVAALFLWFAAMLSGGFDDLLSPGGPVETDREVVEAGAQAREELAAVPLPVTTAAVAEEQQCEVGEHNWKIDDDFDLSCVTTRTTLSPVPAPVFREQALALHEELVRDGWTSEYGDIPSVIREYWDVLAAEGDYAPGDLPSTTYARGELRLEVRWLSAGGRYPAEPAPGADLVSPQQHVVSLAVSTESFRA